MFPETSLIGIKYLHLQIFKYNVVMKIVWKSFTVRRKKIKNPQFSQNIANVQHVKDFFVSTGTILVPGVILQYRTVQ